MATKVYKEEEFTLQDDTVVVVKPLPIKPLRKFMDSWKRISKLTAESDETDAVEIMFDCAYIAVEWFNKDVTKTQLEESLDMPTLEKILSLAGNLQMGELENDPKAKA